MRYTVDSADNITSVSEEWLRFASENGASHLNPDSVVGLPLWRFITGTETTHLWKLLLRRIRQGHKLSFTLRCDAPHARRVLSLFASPTGGDGVLIATEVVREVPRLPVELLVPRASSVGQPISICSWCNRVRIPSGRWSEVDEAIPALNLFHSALLPGIEHGLCSDCNDRVVAEASPEENLGA